MCTNEPPLEERILRIERALLEIQERNTRVAADKAWETSLTRKLSICAVTYLVTGAVFAVLAAPAPLLSALIPTIGFLLSTLTIPLVKQIWLKGR
jgi:hypothetical protein